MPPPSGVLPIHHLLAQLEFWLLELHTEKPPRKAPGSDSESLAAIGHAGLWWAVINVEAAEWDKPDSVWPSLKDADARAASLGAYWRAVPTWAALWLRNEEAPGDVVQALRGEFGLARPAATTRAVGMKATMALLERVAKQDDGSLPDLLAAIREVEAIERAAPVLLRALLQRQVPMEMLDDVQAGITMLERISKEEP